MYLSWKNIVHAFVPLTYTICQYVYTVVVTITFTMSQKWIYLIINKTLSLLLNFLLLKK